MLPAIRCKFAFKTELGDPNLLLNMTDLVAQYSAEVDDQTQVAITHVPVTVDVKIYRGNCQPPMNDFIRSFKYSTYINLRQSELA